MHEGPHMKRLKLIMVMTGILWLVLWGRVGIIQGVRHQYYRGIAEGQRVKPITLRARRGAILDRNGNDLARDVSSASYEVRPQEIDDPDAVATGLSRVTGVSKSTIIPLLTSNREYCWFLRQVEPEIMRKIDALDIKGIRKIHEYRRCYPLGAIGAQVLGYCDVDGQGIEGYELYANDFLAGHDGRSIAFLDAFGRVSLSLDAPMVEPENGLDIRVTLDWKIQEIADEEVGACVADLDAEWGGAIVLDPETGEILAMSNTPRFDPNHPGECDPALRRNRIATDMIEPGSTFKIVTFAEAFESDMLTENDLVDCENGHFTIGSHTIDDSHKLGIVTAREVLVHSSNIGAVKIAEKLGKRRLYERIRLMGFGTMTGLDVPDESKGLIDKPNTWSNLTLPTVSYGHGVAVSPIQLAQAYAAVANGGFLLRPYMIKEIGGGNGHPGKITEKRTIRRVMSDETASRLENLLCDVVESGTGRTAALPNIRIAGKTGTAQRVKEGERGYERGKYISSFIGYITDREPKILCLVMIDSPKGPYYGSQVAAPVFRKIVNRILNMGDSPVALPAVAEREMNAAPRECRVPDVKNATVVNAGR